MKISFIIPCYNEEDNVRQMKDSLSKSYEKYDDVSLELIFIDDGSTDKTLENLKSLESDEKTEVKIIELSRHFGKESAMFAGLSLSKGDYVCNIDGDCQQDPEFTVKMFDMLKENKNIDCVATVATKRLEKKSSKFFKSAFYKIMNFLSETKFENGASDFRMYTRQVANAILEMKEYHRFTKGLFSFVGFNVVFMDYTPLARLNSQSKWSFKKLFYYALEGFLSFGQHLFVPLFFVGGILLLISIIMFLFGIIGLFAKSHSFISIYTLINFLFFIEGIKLPAIAVLGEYISKIYIQTKNRPIFIAKNYFNQPVKNKKEN